VGKKCGTGRVLRARALKPERKEPKSVGPKRRKGRKPYWEERKVRTSSCSWRSGEQNTSYKKRVVEVSKKETLTFGKGVTRGRYVKPGRTRKKKAEKKTDKC